MKIDFDDPKWTAYVLGELSPEERRAVELELEASEELKLFVEELHIAAFAMKDAMVQDASLGLTFQQRSVVRAAAEGKAPALVRSERAWFQQPFVWAAAGLAAAGLILMFLPSVWRSKGVEPVANQASKVEEKERTAAAPGGAPAPVPLASPQRDAPGGAAKPQDSRPDSIVAQADADKRALPALGRSLEGPALQQRTDEVLRKGAVLSEALDRAQQALSGRQELPLSVPVPPAATGVGARGGRGQAAGGGGGGGAADLGELFSSASSSRFDRASNTTGNGVAIAMTPPPPTVIVAGAAAPPPRPAVVPNPVDANALRLNSEVEFIGDNPFIFTNTPVNQVSTLGIDVDTASYSNIRRFINSGQLPPRAAVRIEEMLNYFSYDYPKGTNDGPITANIEAAAAPWNPAHRLVRVGIKAKAVQMGDKPSNLVFLIDVSGSMEPAERLPLLKSGLSMLVERLTENDRVSIVTYAGSSGIALPPTNGTRKDVIRQAIEGLRADGSTNGGEGIQTAYDLAAANFIRGGVNRVILLTDGDFNVGITDQNALVRLIEDKAKTGVFLSVLGVGTGNVKDAMMERLADRGNGNYAYIDSLNEARKVLVEQMGGTLITVAKDVKMQVEFNPAQVSAYRLIGYEDRVLATADFNNDRRDAGDMGSGHTVTALFEVVPVGVEVNNFPGAGPLRYQPEPPRTVPLVSAAVSKEMLSLRIKYQEPEGTESKLIDFPLVDRGQAFDSASVDFRFAAAVAEFGMLLRSSPYRGTATWESSIAIARASRGADREGYREEFIRLVQQCEQIVRSAAR